MTTISTQRELAALLGVSPVAVSRALRGKEGVSEPLRRHIRHTALQHGLVSAAPETLIPAGQRHVVAVIVPLTHDEESAKRLAPFNSALLRGVQEAVEARGGEAILCDDRGPEWPRPVLRREVDGIILPSPYLKPPKKIATAPVPAVTCFLSAAGADRVLVDDFRAGELLGEHLGQLGHRRVAFIGPRQKLAIRRAAGLNAALSAVGGAVLPEHFLLDAWKGDGSMAADLLGRLWEGCGGTVAGLRRTVTAIVGYNDAAANHIRAFLLAHGVRIPEDISLGGVDGAAPLGAEDYGLTTVELPLAAIGAEAVNLLYWRRETPHAPLRNLVFEPVFQPGATTGPASTP